MQDVIEEYKRASLVERNLKYKEVLTALFNLKKVYMVATPPNIAKDGGNSVCIPSLIENGSGQLTVRIFSDKEIGKKLCKKYHLTKDGKETLIEISIEQFITVLKSNLIKGIQVVLIDEGSNSIEDTVANIMKNFYNHIGKPELYIPELVGILKILNYILRKDWEVYMIPKAETTYIDLLSNKAKSIIEIRHKSKTSIVPFFLDKKTADKYGIKQGYVTSNNSPYNVKLDKHQFYLVILKLSKEVELIELNTFKENFQVHVSTLLELMNDMGFYSN